MIIKKIKKLLLKIGIAFLITFTLFIPVKAADKSTTIILDYAHRDTAQDYGATYGEYKESEIANNITEKVGNKLKEKGFTVLYTRDKYSTTTIEERIQFTEENYYDSYISIHLNSADHIATGTEAYSNNQWTLSNNIIKEISAEFNIPKRGVKSTPYYNIYIPNSTILELGFINSDIDILINHQEELAEIVANAIINQFSNSEIKDFGNFTAEVKYKE